MAYEKDLVASFQQLEASNSFGVAFASLYDLLGDDHVVACAQVVASLLYLLVACVLVVASLPYPLEVSRKGLVAFVQGMASLPY